MANTENKMEFSPGSFQDSREIMRCLQRLEKNVSRMEGKMDVLFEDREKFQAHEQEVESRIRSLESSRSRMYGYIAAASAMALTAWWFVRDRIKGVIFG